jgi:hypothetical protein
MKHVVLNIARLSLLTALVLAVFSGVVFAQNLDARFALHAKDKFTATKALNSKCPTFDDNGTPGDPSDDSPVASYDPNWDDVPCTDYTVAYGGSASTVFVVLGQATSGMTGASYGITYTGSVGVGIDPRFISWAGCTDGLEFPNAGANGDYPAKEGGIRVTWNTCQDGDFRGSSKVVGGSGLHLVIGSFYVYVYGEDLLELTPNNNLQSGPELAMTACAGGTTDYLTILDPSLVPFALGRVHFGGDGTQGYTPCGVIPTKETTWGHIKNLYMEN